DMDHRRHLAVVGALQRRVDAERAFLQAPIDPHGHVVVHLAVAALDADGLGQFQHVPDMPYPGTDTDDHRVAIDAALVGHHGLHRAAIVALETRDLHAGHDPHVFVLGFLGEAVDGGAVVGVATFLFVQHGGDTLGLPVVEQALHVLRAVALTFDEHRLV